MEWISVEDRLPGQPKDPDKVDKYLLFDGLSNEYQVAYKTKVHGGNPNYLGFTTAEAWVKPIYPTHWMLIPEPTN